MCQLLPLATAVATITICATAAGAEQPVKIHLNPGLDETPQLTLAEEVERILRRRSGGFRLCYQTASQSHADLRCKVLLQLTVGTEGMFTAATVTGAPTEMNECIRQKLLTVRGLPPLNSPESLSQTLVFEPTMLPPPPKQGEIPENHNLGNDVPHQHEPATPAGLQVIRAHFAAKRAALDALDAVRWDRCLRREPELSRLWLYARWGDDGRWAEVRAEGVPPSVQACVVAALSAAKPVPKAAGVEQTLAMAFGYFPYGVDRSEDNSRVYPTDAGLARAEKKAIAAAKSPSQLLPPALACLLRRTSANIDAELQETGAEGLDKVPTGELLQIEDHLRHGMGPTHLPFILGLGAPTKGQLETSLRALLRGMAQSPGKDKEPALQAFASLLPLFAERADVARAVAMFAGSVGSAGARIGETAYGIARQLLPQAEAATVALAVRQALNGQAKQALQLLVPLAEAATGTDLRAKSIRSELTALIAIIAAAAAQQSPQTAGQDLQMLIKAGIVPATVPQYGVFVEWEAPGDAVLHVKDGSFGEMCTSRPAHDESLGRARLGAGWLFSALEAKSKRTVPVRLTVPRMGPLGYVPASAILPRWDGKHLTGSTSARLATRAGETIEFGRL